MSNTTLNWALRRVLRHLRDEGRLAVLLCYVLHANERGRAWPSTTTIMAETGWSRASVVSAKGWLIEHQALERVPVDKRVEAEAERHHLRDVIQVTGWLAIEGELHPILHFNEQTNTGANGSASKPFYGSVVKSLATEPEGINKQEDTDKQDVAVVVKNLRALAPVLDANGTANVTELDAAVDAYGAERVLEVAEAYLSRLRRGSVKTAGWFHKALLEGWDVTGNSKNGGGRDHAGGRYADEIES